MVVSPDVGGVVRARALAKRLDDADLVIIDKRRDRANQSEVMNIIGEVEGKNCIMMDDMVDTAGTLCHAAAALKATRRDVGAGLHHPSGAVRAGRQRITESELDEVVVTDTIPLNDEAKACSKIRQLSTAELLAETMRRISDEESVSSLYSTSRSRPAVGILPEWLAARFSRQKHPSRPAIRLASGSTRVLCASLRDRSQFCMASVRRNSNKINQIMEISHG